MDCLRDYLAVLPTSFFWRRTRSVITLVRSIAMGNQGAHNTIMGTTLGSSTLQTFCPFSVNQIETRANAYSCLPFSINHTRLYLLPLSHQPVGRS